jgi:hypothetical protein
MENSEKNVMYLFRPGWTIVSDDALWNDALDFAVRAGADAVLAFNEHFQTPPHPDLDRVRKHAAILKRRFADVRAHGLSPHINYFVTLGHAAAKPASTMNMYQEIIDGNGNQVLGCLCPLDTAFQQYICEAYRIYAEECNADTIWIDDDFRLYDREGSETLQCFCDLHLDMFAERVGKRYEREELMGLLVEHGKPDRELRREWFAMQGETLVQLIDKLRESVLSANPNTGMGIMIPHVPVNFLSGRDLNKEFTALATAAHPAPWVRTGGGFYTDERPLDLLEKVIQVADPIPAIVDVPALICCEIENYPFIQGKKSAHALGLEMYMNAISGNGLLSFSIQDGYLGMPFVTDAVENTITGMKPYIQALTNEKEGMVRKGVSVPYPKNRIEIGELERDKLTPYWNFNMARLGIAQAPTDATPVILSGQIVELYERVELERMLEKGAILDAEAYYLLQQRGILADCPIVLKKEPFATKVQMEKISVGHAPSWIKDRMIPTRWHVWFNTEYTIGAGEGAEVWSALFDTEGLPVSAGVVVADRPYRIAVVPYTGQPLRELGRQWLLQQVVNYVSMASLPVMVERILELYPVWYDNGAEAVLGLSFFGLENYPNVDLWLPGHQSVVSMERLERSGEWVQADYEVTSHPDGGIRITLTQDSVPAPLSFETFRLKF